VSNFAPGENFAKKIGSGFGMPWRSVRRPWMYIDGMEEGLCSEWNRAFPVPSGN